MTRAQISIYLALLRSVLMCTIATYQTWIDSLMLSTRPIVDALTAALTMANLRLSTE